MREMLHAGIETRMNLRQSDILPRDIVILSVSKWIFLRIYFYTYAIGYWSDHIDFMFDQIGQTQSHFNIRFPEDGTSWSQKLLGKKRRLLKLIPTKSQTSHMKT